MIIRYQDIYTLPQEIGQNTISRVTVSQNLPNDIVVVGYITAKELLPVDDRLITKESTWAQLDDMFKHVDWQLGFEKKFFILYDDAILPENLIFLHYWLRNKCTNIENIFFLCTPQIIKRWWTDWCHVMGEKSFKVIDIGPLTAAHRYIKCTLPLENKSKSIKKHFSYYGGTISSPQKNYILLEITEYYDYGYIDNLATILPKQQIIDQIEKISYFQSQQTIDNISRRYDEFVHDGKFNSNTPLTIEDSGRRIDEPVDQNGWQYQIDRQCFACVIRETFDYLPYPAFTEKTLRAFYHGCMPIPLGYRAVEELELYGFKFLHDFFDYGYQYEKDFFSRIKKMKHSLQKWIIDFPTDTLATLWSDNQEIFEHNSKHISTILQPDRIIYDSSKD